MQQSDEFVLLKQEETLIEAETPLQGPDRVEVTVRNRSREVDEAILFLSN